MGLDPVKYLSNTRGLKEKLFDENQVYKTILCNIFPDEEVTSHGGRWRCFFLSLLVAVKWRLPYPFTFHVSTPGVCGLPLFHA